MTVISPKIRVPLSLRSIVVPMLIVKLYSQLSPVALLLLNLEFLTVPLIPFQYIAPPLRRAVLLVKVMLSIIPPCAPSSHAIAPPLISAILFSKIQSLMVTLVQFSVDVASRNTPPPRLAAVLSVNLQSVILQ